MKLARKFIWGVDDEEETTKHNQSLRNKQEEKDLDHSLKVICAGYPRTGTTSLRAALNSLRFETYDLTEVSILNDFAIWDTILRGKLQCGLSLKSPMYDFEDWNKIYAERGFVACTDIPNCVMFRELSTFYPNAKIVLTVRDSESWYLSCMNSIHRIGTLFHNRWLLRFLSRKNGHFLENTWNHLMLVDDTKRIDTDYGLVHFEADKAAAIAAYETFNNNVIRWCNENNKQLLIYRITDGYEPLCRLLDVDVPNCSFPHTNSSQQQQSVIRNLTILCNCVNAVLCLGACGIAYIGVKSWKWYVHKKF